ncbi:MAG: DUF4350 domain-containing protein [Pseudomonadota bacterium]
MSAADSNPFNPRIIAGLIVAGIIGFVGFWVLTAFTPELGNGRNAQAHALSRSAVGFAGVVELAKAGGAPITVLRGASAGVPGADDSEFGGLMVLTPLIGTTRAQIDERIGDFAGSVLIVLPKYLTGPALTGRDRVMRMGDVPDTVTAMLDSNVEGKSVTFLANRGPAGQAQVATRLWDEDAVTLRLPGQLQGIVQHDGAGMRPLITVGTRIIVAELPGRGSTYVLSDPDLINNLAMADDARAASAYALLTALAGPGEPIGFDVTMNGLGSGGRSLLRMAFVPPFLGLTMCLLAGGLFALWQGFVRFGPPWREARRVALGKAGLVANGAALIVQARRVPHFAARYGAMVREAAARRLHAPSALSGSALDIWLDRFADGNGRRFSEILSRLEIAQTAGECVEGAAALVQWRKDVLRDSE